MFMPKLVAIDGNSLLYRGFFATRALTTSAGQPTNALFAFANMLLTLLENEKPSVVYCAWDHPAPTFRHEAFKAYKGTRQETPADLTAQGSLARELTVAFGVPVLETPGYEADDILGTLAVLGKAAGYEVLIVTGDSDALQLVEPNVQVMMPLKGVTDTKTYDEAEVKKRYGLDPVQLTDYRALKGDSSDNIPGVPGIGEKTATALLQQYGTIEKLQECMDEITPSRVQAALVGAGDKMNTSKMLATIIKNVTIPELDLLPATDAPARHAPDWNKVRDLFERLEFRSLMRRVPKDVTAPAGRDLDDPNYDPFSDEATGAGETKKAEAATLDVREVVDQAAEAEMQAALGKAEGVGLCLHIGEGDVHDAPLYGVALAVGQTVFYVPVATEPVAKGDALGGLFDGGEKAMPSTGRVALPSLPPVTVHDAKTTAAVLARMGVALENITFDTELAAYLLMAGRRASFPLHEVAEDFAGRFVPAPVADLDKKSRAALSEEVAFAQEKERAIRGAEAVLAVRAVQEPRLSAENTLAVLTEIELPVAPILAEMERNGVLVDVPTLNRISQSLQTKAAEMEHTVYELAGVTFSIASTKQLQEVLYEKLKLPAGKKTKTGYSTDAETLEELAADYPIVNHILQWRELTKLKNTYTDAMPALVRADGRVHTSLNQTVAATGRLSSTNPNLQNIPIRTPVGREIRQAFIAPPGWELLSVDYSQIELRLIAHTSDDPELKAAFVSGEDIHKYTASRMYNIEVADVTSDMRRAAKTVNYAVLYGISDFALGRQLKIPQADAKALKQSYFERFPKVREYLDSMIAFAKEHGYVQTLDGRRRYLPDIHSRIFNIRQGAERAATNMPIQGTSADIMKKAMIAVHKRMHAENVAGRLLLQVHDELLFETPTDELPMLAEMVRVCMEGAASLSVALDVETKRGRNWGEVVAF
jgi:DNA polymerase-1